MDTADRTLPELTKDVALQLGDLVRNEVRLARAELMDSARDFVGASLRFALGIGLAAAAVTLALLALAYALGERLPMWAAALAASIIGAACAYVLIRSGQSALGAGEVSLKRTGRQISQDIRTIKETLAS